MAGLNPVQHEAVLHSRGPLLIFAGAGSGKTRVITHRIARLVREERIAPYRILAVTFTNKAAREMLERLETLLGYSLRRDMWVGTFHATCARLLRRFGSPVGLTRDFVIYDTDDQRAVVARALRDLRTDDREFPPRAVLSRILSEKQEGKTAETMACRSYRDETIAKAFARYEQLLRASNAVDFEDLIAMTVRLLATESREAEEMKSLFSHVLVDEFQDTNILQYALVRALSERERNLAVVGDDDQSIYRWRGADVRNIRGFRNDFPDAKVVKLEENYRSSGNIVRAALGVIAEGADREDKELWTKNELGAPVAIVKTESERDEAEFVAQSIDRARAEGVSPSEIAIFYRIHAQSRVIEERLRARRIPYRIYGGVRFFERAEVKDVLSYLRLLVVPESDVDVLRVINVPARGIGKTTIDRLTSFARGENLSLFAALDRARDSAELAGATAKKLATFRALLDDLRNETAGHSPTEIFREVMAKTEYEATLRRENTIESEARLENLAQLALSLEEYEAEAEAAGEPATLREYLERISLDVERATETGTDVVSLMTVHGAKGLEFDRVFLVGMEDELFPYRSREGADPRDLEEERRLAYVAITRAKRELAITFADRRQLFGSTQWTRPSRFLEQIPRDAATFMTTDAVSRYAPSGASLGPSRHIERDGEREGRYVDTEYADDAGHQYGEGLEVRRGSRVRHKKFGEGEVRSVVTSADPTIVAYFPGWGEKKVLARFLEPA